MPVIRLRHCAACQHAVHPDGRCACGQQHGRSRRPEYATALWSKLRAQAIALHPWCSECGTSDDLTGDHLVYPARTVDDVRVLCRPCNSAAAALGTRTQGGGAKTDTLDQRRPRTFPREKTVGGVV